MIASSLCLYGMLLICLTPPSPVRAICVVLLYPPPLLMSSCTGVAAFNHSADSKRRNDRTFFAFSFRFPASLVPLRDRLSYLVFSNRRKARSRQSSIVCYPLSALDLLRVEVRLSQPLCVFLFNALADDYADRFVFHAVEHQGCLNCSLHFHPERDRVFLPGSSSWASTRLDVCLVCCCWIAR